MNKYFSMEEMANVVDDLGFLFADYKANADNLIGKLESYRDNESYLGDDAIASKNLVNVAEIGFVNKQLAMQQKLVDMYKHSMESFAEKIDSAFLARVDTDVLDLIAKDMRTIYADLDTIGASFSDTANDLQAKYGHIVSFTKPRVSAAKETLAAFCGGAIHNSGYLHELKNKLINYDAEECAYIDGQNFDEEIGTLNGKIRNTGIKLACIGVVLPKPKSFFLKKNLFGKGAAMLSFGMPKGNSRTKTMKKLSKEEIYAIIAARYNFSSDDMEYLEKYHSDLLMSLYGASKYSTYDEQIILGRIKKILDFEEWGIQCGDYTFSPDAIELLKDLEQGDYGLGKYGVYDENGKLIGIMPHYVGDGGITLGYGHYVSESEYEKIQSEQELIDSYVHQESIIFDSPAGLVEESEYVSINTVNRLLQSDIQEQMEHIVPWLEENNIEVTQNELEALVIYRYNRGSLSSECKDLLMEGDRNESDWEDIWTGPPDRVEACQELFFDE